MGRLPEGAVSRQPVTGMDFYPTLLELAGLPPRDDQHMDGKSITNNLFHPDQIEERTLVWHYPHYHGSPWRPGSAIRQGRWKLIEFYEENKVELYDLTREIGERDDIAEQNPDVAAALREEMHTYIEERGGRYPERVSN